MQRNSHHSCSRGCQLLIQIKSKLKTFIIWPWSNIFSNIKRVWGYFVALSQWQPLPQRNQDYRITRLCRIKNKHFRRAMRNFLLLTFVHLFLNIWKKFLNRKYILKGTISNDSIKLFSQFLRKTILPRSISGPELIFSRLRHQFLSWELQSARWGFRCRDHPQTNCQRSSFLWALFWVASLITSTPLMWTLLILKRAKSKKIIFLALRFAEYFPSGFEIPGYFSRWPPQPLL